ncbi:MAG: hypothetical protein CSA21_02035 [Deltaproteobacteria bacterium]|nr:MAG: hypothetical protein CSA21_02035 [Deltaproteobacteria bacterium]
MFVPGDGVICTPVFFLYLSGIFTDCKRLINSFAGFFSSYFLGWEMSIFSLGQRPATSPRSYLPVSSSKKRAASATRFADAACCFFSVYLPCVFS